ncbi:hypothetical protein Hypma_002776 [Hypsizygus marmoreus]|uniref:F-box domain-containing protein n=1 Tax=Hypsizygus marmoreus TaxID=39966 RepID=A0A369J308_HYPMA|nr:hypothetical protein Hypma_002776 [Hypsizygus marmoreus]
MASDTSHVREYLPQSSGKWLGQRRDLLIRRLREKHQKNVTSHSLISSHGHSSEVVSIASPTISPVPAPILVSNGEPPDLGIIPTMSQTPPLGYSPKIQTYIHALPPELLCEIFIHCLPPLQECPRPAPQIAPMLLCQICRYWRQVAVAFSHLWCSFSSCKPDDWRAIDSCLAWRYLVRSHNQPLTLEIYRDFERTIMPQYIKNIHRWRHVSFGLSPSRYEFLTIPAKRAERLEGVKIHAAGWTSKQLESVPLIVNEFPNLRSLEWYSQHRASKAFIGMVWEKLEHITIIGPTRLRDCVYILSQCQRVKTAEFRGIDVLCDTVNMVVVPSLQSLQYNYSPNCATTRADVELLDLLTLPALHTLKLGTKVKNLGILEQFIERSACTLEVFHIADVNLKNKDIAQYLRLPCLRSLHELILSPKKITNKTVRLLTYPKSASGDLEVAGLLRRKLVRLSVRHWKKRVEILPHLQRLVLSGCRTTDGLLSKMVDSRMQTHADLSTTPTKSSLTDVSFWFPLHQNKQFSPHTRDVQNFEKFMRDGLMINWRWEHLPKF